MGQVLTKNSASDYDTSWTTVGGGGGASLSRYIASSTANEEVEVFADGSGITFARVGAIGTFTIPAGVNLISARIRLPMATIGGTQFTVVYGTSGGAGTNTSAANAWRPNYHAWREDSGATVAVAATISAGFDRLTINGLTSGVTCVLKLAF
jgi:hypothetical protein